MVPCRKFAAQKQVSTDLERRGGHFLNFSLSVLGAAGNDRTL